MKYIASIVALLALSVAAAAQTPGVVVSAASEAVVAHYQGMWTPGNHTTESFDVIDWGAQKGNSFSAEIHEFLLPTINVNSYLAGGKFVPDISALVKKTNIPSDQFQVFLQAGGGVTNVPAGSKTTFMGGGGAAYRATPNLTWTVLDGYVLCFGGQCAPTASTGLVYTFNPAASQSLMMKRLIARRAAIK
jgi:hypothetical protein